MKVEIEIPDKLHENTRDLVVRFAAALAKKLRKAEVKYGYSDGWAKSDWIDNGECQQKLIEHLKKGDPRDVAIYCAFLWSAGASTTEPMADALAQEAYRGTRCAPDHVRDHDGHR